MKVTLGMNYADSFLNSLFHLLWLYQCFISLNNISMCKSWIRKQNSFTNDDFAGSIYFPLLQYVLNRNNVFSSSQVVGLWQNKNKNVQIYLHVMLVRTWPTVTFGQRQRTFCIFIIFSEINWWPKVSIKQSLQGKIVTMATI